MDLKKMEAVETDIILASMPKEEFHFVIKQEDSQYHLEEVRK